MDGEEFSGADRAPAWQAGRELAECCGQRWPAAAQCACSDASQTAQAAGEEIGVSAAAGIQKDASQ